MSFQKVIRLALLTGIGVFSFTAPSSAQAADAGSQSAGELFETRVAAGGEPLVAESGYKLWVPQDTPVIRCLFVINMRAAGKHLFFKDAEWRALAASNAAAMMYCEFESKGVRENGYGLSMLTACDQFADELDRPELRHAPFVLWGHSMGGRVAQDFVRFKPSRVLAFHIALRAHPSSEEFMQEEAEATRVPALYLMGKADAKPKDIRQHYKRAREAGAPRAWVWLPGQQHWPKGMHFDKDETTAEQWRAWAANNVVIPWTDVMIRLRLPEDADARQGPVELLPIDPTRGWLADTKTGDVRPYSKFAGKPSKASWLPNEEVARAWARFSMP
ncbi:MAG: hypothetical protein AAF589_08875 [Planctomycetota bacterium]